MTSGGLDSNCSIFSAYYYLIDDSVVTYMYWHATERKTSPVCADSELCRLGHIRYNPLRPAN
jgi:hypothetical protein